MNSGMKIRELATKKNGVETERLARSARTARRLPGPVMRLGTTASSRMGNAMKLSMALAKQNPRNVLKPTTLFVVVMAQYTPMHVTPVQSV